VTLSLRSFLETGRLGGLALGKTGMDVETILGRTTDISVPGRPVIWRYGPLQIFFDSDIVNSIGLYLGERNDLPEQLQIVGYSPVSGTSIEEFLEYLHGEGLAYAQDSDLTYDEALCLVVGIGVDAYFTGDPLTFKSFQYPGAVRPDRPLQPYPMDRIGGRG
jgi:hypothetical protein